MCACGRRLQNINILYLQHPIGTILPNAKWISVPLFGSTTFLLFSSDFLTECAGCWQVFGGRHFLPRLSRCLWQTWKLSWHVSAICSFPPLFTIRSPSSKYPARCERWQMYRWPDMSAYHSPRGTTSESSHTPCPLIKHLPAISIRAITELIKIKYIFLGNLASL